MSKIFSVNMVNFAGPFIDNLGRYGLGTTIGGYLYALDDNSCVYFDDFFPNSSGGFSVWVVDGPTGKYTYYAALSAYTGATYINRILTYGNGNFLVFLANGATYYVQVGNHKLNNASPIMIRPSSVPVSNSCDSTDTPVLFYDGTQKVLAAGWYHSNSQYGGLIYGSVYAVGPTGALTRLTDGFSGTYLSAGGGTPHDDWNRTGGSNSPTVSNPFSDQWHTRWVWYRCQL